MNVLSIKKDLINSLKEGSSILDIKDIVRITKFSERQIYRFMKGGKLKYFYEGSTRNILKSDLIDFLCTGISWFFCVIDS